MPHTHRLLHPRLRSFSPHLVIFDKDGTLIDFEAMWRPWIEQLGQRIIAQTNLILLTHLYDSIGYNAHTGKMVPDGIAAAASLAEFQQHLITFLINNGLSEAEAKRGFWAAWFEPDPLAVAYPLTDLPILFSNLRHLGSKIAVATSDNRASTEATLVGLEVRHLIDDLICADDGVPIKPAPHIIQHLCQILGISPTKTVMVGDNLADLQMGRAAKVGLTIGVTSGVCNEGELTPYADLVLSSINDLLT